MTDAAAATIRATVETVSVDAADGPADALIGLPRADGPFPAVLVYTDAYGIRPSVHAYVERLAAHGYLVLVPNIFYRHGPPPVVPDIERRIMSEDRSALFEALTPLMAALTPDAVVADARAWLGYLGERPEVRDGPVGTVGYCLGGRLSLRTAGAFPDAVAAAASFHGGNLATTGEDSPHLVAVHAKAELYIGHADNDRSMDPEQMARLTRALAEAHVRHTAELYVGAGHGWTQPDTPVYDEASAERHWMRMLDLFGRAVRA
ncbi:MAG TPA: dienelactone hydrolase family protein [Gaiellales bacterium]|nr:dienelactone hydrolase family protein [Gaiellales bacterium]